MSNNFMQMYNDRTIQLMEAEGKLKKALAENERLKDDCNAILGRFLNLLPDADVLKACESEQSLLAYFKEKLARLAEYESTPERGLKAVMGFHKMDLRASTFVVHGERVVQLAIETEHEIKVMKREPSDGIDDIVLLTAEDIENANQQLEED